MAYLLFVDAHMVQCKLALKFSDIPMNQIKCGMQSILVKMVHRSFAFVKALPLVMHATWIGEHCLNYEGDRFWFWF